ncbi:MAG TPA: hypothetical protein VFE46_02755 [Pirellulales bacterium]|nr:hypothetical protein [Pirellulales bacterium]
MHTALFRYLVVGGAWALFFTQTAFATPATSVAASDNATVQGGGPRGGANGKNFFNLEGSSNGTFASFGVADFDFSPIKNSFGGTVTGVSNAELLLTEANNSSSAAGPISVYYTDNTSVDIQPGTSPLVDQTGNDGLASIDPALTGLSLLGSGSFSDVGTVDTVSLTSLSGSALSAFVSALNGGSTLRFVVTADNASTFATFAGATNGTAAGPTLAFDVTVAPEPSAFILGAISFVGWLGAKRLRRD